MAMDNDPQYRTDDGAALRIWRDAVKNNFLSEGMGRPVFDDAIFVEVIAPGSQGSTPVFEVKRTFHEDMNMKPAIGMQYAQYQKFIEDFEKGEESDKSLTGTPLREWSEISRTFAASLKVSGIHSVEGLASLSDEKLSVVGPDGRSWRTKAQAYIETAKNSGHATKLAAELQVALDDAAQMRTQMAAMAAKIDALEAQKGAAKVQAKPAPATETPAPAGALGDII